IVFKSVGCKKNLLRMLSCLENIDSGTFMYNGQELTLEELGKRHLLGFVFKEFQLFPHLSVLEKLFLSPMKTQNMSRSE
ncbi:amino acid ABC transporter ATP-binding protein, partial [Streptococcus suis]